MKILSTEMELRAFINELRSGSALESNFTLLVNPPFSEPLNNALSGVQELKNIDRATTAKSMAATFGGALLGGPVGLSVAIIGLAANHFTQEAKRERIINGPLHSLAKSIIESGFEKISFTNEQLTLRKR